MQRMVRFLTTCLFVSSLCRADCPEWANDKSHLPLCPDNGFLSDEFPALAHVVALSPTSNQDQAEEQRNRLQHFIRKLFVYADKSPFVFVSATEADWKALHRELSAINLSSSVKKQIEKNLRWIPVAKGTGIAWQQDIFETFVNPLTGQLSVRAVKDYENGGTNYGQIHNLITSLNQECPMIKEGPPLRPFPSQSQGHESGGNIEFAPGGICIVGDTQNPAYTRQFCSEKDTVVIPTQHLKVGHADEMMSVHRFSEPECRIVIQAASYQTALELFEKRGHQTLFDFFVPEVPDSVPQKKKREWQLKKLNDSYPGGMALFCQWFEKRPESVVSSKEVLPLVSSLHEEKKEGLRPVASSIKVSCDKALVRDFIAFIKGSEEANREIDSKMEQSVQTLTEKLKARNPNCPVVRVQAPQVHVGAHSYFPNPVNLVRSGDTLIFPDPQNELFRNHLKEEFKKNKISISFSESLDLHALSGNLHCATASLRVCQPNPKAKQTQTALDNSRPGTIPKDLTLDDRTFIEHLARSPDARVRRELLERLHTLLLPLPDMAEGWKRLGYLLDVMAKEDDKEVLSKLARIAPTQGEKGLQWILKRLASPQTSSLAFWSFFPEEELNKKLLPVVLSHSDATVVHRALRASFFEGRKDVNYATFAHHGDPEVRASAIEFLSSSRHPQLSKLLVEAMQDKSERVRVQAVREAHHLPLEAAEKIYRTGLKDREMKIREAASVQGHNRFPEAFRTEFLTTMASNPKLCFYGWLNPLNVSDWNPKWSETLEKVLENQRTKKELIQFLRENTDDTLATKLINNANSTVVKKLIEQFDVYYDRALLESALSHTSEIVWRAATLAFQKEKNFSFSSDRVKDLYEKRVQQLKP